MPTILFVDDEQALLDAMTRLLRREPYDVISVTSTSAAVDILRTRDIDVVVSDERMPGMSGAEFLDHVRTRYPDVVRIMLTGEGNLNTNSKIIGTGELYRFLCKPFDSDELRKVLSQAIRRREMGNLRLQMPR